ncbi:citrate synthase [Collimonas sp. OK242]|jgi:citrate synthase|uniref:citryl-CoA lyase n=1 Tax=Collimonas sp. OK242 TaxID=1798195 RepID=UPI00089A3FB3|nr:citryl-CoA lyase [Collimonas sp. OK242]SDY92707.1 citrate synthase [Collimonas sp. OK242]
MSDQESPHTIHSSIWQEEAEADNPFVAAACYCRGYDVYGDLLGKISYIEYLYLLFKGERPEPAAIAVLEILAVVLANPGPRDPSVHAAMAAGVGGSTAASVLMAALAVGAGSHGGAREVFLALEAWKNNGTELATWRSRLACPVAPTRLQVWPEPEHPPGFDPYGKRCANPVRQALAHLVEIMPAGCLAWLAQEREALETAAGHPLAMTGVAAAAFADLDFSASEGEMLTLLLRLPGAAAHALEQGKQGFRQFPFFELDLENDPGPAFPKEQA